MDLAAPETANGPNRGHFSYEEDADDVTIPVLRAAGTGQRGDQEAGLTCGARLALIA